MRLERGAGDQPVAQGVDGIVGRGPGQKPAIHGDPVAHRRGEAFRRLPQPDGGVALRAARTCYDHLAGELAVGVFARMLDAGWIEQEGRTLRLSATGEAGLAGLGIDLAEVRRRRRQFACACPDWSERKPHLGGALGLSPDWGRKLRGHKVLSTELTDYVTRVVQHYVDHREEGETFRQWVVRADEADLR